MLTFSISWHAGFLLGWLFILYQMRKNNWAGEFPYKTKVMVYFWIIFCLSGLVRDVYTLYNGSIEAVDNLRLAAFLSYLFYDWGLSHGRDSKTN